MRVFSNLKEWLGPGVIVFLILTTISCERKVMQEDTVVRRGVRYEIGKEEPFTGIVVGKGREDYRRTVFAYEKTYKNGLQHGVTCYWYENGKLESREKYIEGKIHGIVTRYYPNGKHKARIHFDHGMRGGGQGEMYWDQKGRQIRK